jgi:hypothetical protein
MHCKSCGKDGGQDEFYVSNSTRCKGCIKASVTANRIANIEHYRSFDRLRGSLPHRVAARAEYRATDAYKASHTKALKKQIEAHPVKAKARYAVSNAIRDGRLMRLPCMVCGIKAEAHHPDYDRPLDVVWLCSSHHKQAHALTRKHKLAA